MTRANVWSAASTASRGIGGTLADVVVLAISSYSDNSDGQGRAADHRTDYDSEVQDHAQTNRAYHAARPAPPRLFGGSLTGAGSLDVSGLFDWEGTSTVSGEGSLVVESGAEAYIHQFSESSESMTLEGRTLLNDGKARLAGGTLYMSHGAKFENKGTFEVNSGQERAPYGAAIERPNSEGVAPLIVNTGLLSKNEGPTMTKIDVPIENPGTVEPTNGNTIELLAESSGTGGTWGAGLASSLVFGGSKSYSLKGGSLTGAIRVAAATVTVEGTSGTSAQVTVSSSGSMSVVSGSMVVSNLSLLGGLLTGAGSLEVSGAFNWEGTSTISGSGSLILGAKSEGLIHEYNESRESLILEEHTLINKGEVDFVDGTLYMSHGARLENAGTFDANSEPHHIAIQKLGGATPLIVNVGVVTKTAGGGNTSIEVPFENLGGVVAAEKGEGSIEILEPIFVEPETQFGDEEENPSAPEQSRSECGEGVDCSTGNFSQSQTDLAVGGRGVGLGLTRHYNSQAAVTSTEHGMFGYGWSSSFSDHLRACR